jgi:IS30 family transposase
MAGRGRLTTAEKRELWRRWKLGQSTAEIAAALSMSGAGVHHVVRARGGFPPPERTRFSRCLSLSEREEISRGTVAGESIRSISRRLGRAPSTVSREIARNGGVGRYRAAQADARAWQKAERPKPCLLARNARLCQIVAAKLEEDLSPEQIAGWLKVEFEDDESMRISHETIYRSLFIQTRGVLKRELMAHLRSQRLARRAKAAGPNHRRTKTSIADLVSISERPAEVEDRAVPGHWEGDLLIGTQGNAIATLVERHSRFLLLVQVDSTSTISVVNALIREIKTLPEQLRGSLTWDRGGELGGHKRFTMATDMAVYFCDPHSPWQRGSNENINGLLRQYFPKYTSVRGYTQKELNVVADKLNRRPRKTLDFRTPAAILEQAVASTG